ncbi:family 43 glycosylhydrolase [Pinibacter soli]|uniref:Family 43 glycosylhydrolase n=1 Tax=Pinibacter soli TaxID=3044211 RepID=A0ABT6RE53_9BACT|nr:family 43 glycosylhydrolase [Pinibacter soli]MDI3320853.1 family 43 glycosylhydrolase [Pinibacter soli]
MVGYIKQVLLIASTVFAAEYLPAQNPLITYQYSADPSARVFGDKVYIFPSHDILANENRGRPGWFCMEDYHVFSSSDLTHWKDNGVIVTQNKVPWVRPDSYSMWAPDCIYRNGKYYFYFPSTPKDTTVNGKGFTVGVAIAENPEGPYLPQEMPIKGIRGIDPNVFIDKDGQAYLYWSEGNIYVAKLKENMLELASQPQVLTHLPDKGLKEGPYMFERNGTYYLTYPHVANKIERLEYGVGKSPLGPFTVAGVIMDESPTGCWTNHHSIIEFKKQWYLFYHHNDLSPAFDKARSIRSDSLFFNADGTIRKVIPTTRGIGVTQARSKIQMDRYSAISNDVAIDFLDTANKFDGWKTMFNEPTAWVQYNSVEFGKQSPVSVVLRVASTEGGTLEIKLDSINGPVVAQIQIPNITGWKLIKTSLRTKVTGRHHLVAVLKRGNDASLDWIQFE